MSSNQMEPDAETPDETLGTQGAIRWLLFLVLVAVVAGTLYAFVRSISYESEKAACKTAVEANLVSPASASWGPFEVDTGAGLELRGRVDSDNAFGAKLRNHFACYFDSQGQVKLTFSKDPIPSTRERLGLDSSQGPLKKPKRPTQK